jgi:hypothetical protein
MWNTARVEPTISYLRGFLRGRARDETVIDLSKTLEEYYGARG